MKFIVRSQLLGRLIKATRRNAGMTRRDMSQKTGLPVRMLENLEYGTVSPAFHTVATCAKLLRIDLNQLAELSYGDTEQWKNMK